MKEDRRRVTHTANSVALGFAWRAKNIGGVRRHLECIERYSRHAIALYPSTPSHQWLRTRLERDQYRSELGDELISRHSLFHTHVDPHFIGIAERAQKAGKPWLHTYHLLYFAEDWNNELAPWQQRINDSLLTRARKADLCLAVGSWLVEWLKEHHGIDSRFVPNGVDVEACDRACGSRFVESSGLDDFVLFVNSISRVKNPLAFVEAARRFPDQRFVMVGTDLVKEKIESTFEVELPKNLVALGPLPHDQTLDAIAASKSFVMTSHREGLPTVLLEAMAMNKPCVAPNLPWCRDAIKTDAHGILYEAGESDDLNAAIRRSLESNSFADARGHVDALFTWPVIMKQIDSIYAEMLGTAQVSQANCG